MTSHTTTEARKGRKEGLMGLSTVTAIPASGPGALPGFAWTCPTCGSTQASSQQTLAELDAEAHAAWHASR